MKKIKSSQPQTKFTGSYKKKSVKLTYFQSDNSAVFRQKLFLHFQNNFLNIP